MAMESAVDEFATLDRVDSAQRAATPSRGVVVVTDFAQPSTRTHNSNLTVGSDPDTPTSSTGRRASDRASDHHGKRRQLSMVKSAQHSVKQVFTWAGWYESRVACALRQFGRSRSMSVASVLALFVALFTRDIFVALQVPSDVELDVILTIVLVVFATEFLCLSLTDVTYLFRFFWWMDVVGTASLIFDLSYMLGPSATEPKRVDASGNSENTVVLRAARAARLGARAGRLTRVLKLLRFLPFLVSADKKAGGDARMSRVIQSQLNSVLSKRVALLTLLIIVVMPVCELFKYPESDHSFDSWLELLSKDVDLSMAEPPAPVLVQRRDSELQRFSDFYRHTDYGPYEVCHGAFEGGIFSCKEGGVVLTFHAWFSEPRRPASITMVSHGNVQAFYDLSTPAVQEACASIANIWFIIFVMLGFGLLMSNSISAAVLVPLERMLSVIRGHCKQIFKFTEGMEPDAGREEPTDAEGAVDQEGEFALLERAVTKLAAIAHLSSNTELQVTGPMDEDDIMKMNFLTNGSFNPDKGPRRSRLSQRLSRTSSEVPDGEDVGLIETPGLSVDPAIPQEVLQSLTFDHFDVLSWTSEVRAAVAVRVIASSEDYDPEVVTESILMKFVAAVEAAYLPNPYHNFSHGVDIMCTIARWMRLMGANDFMPTDARYSTLIAAIGHDVGHMGVNNQFLVELSQELAVKYNDSSPLEMMHCATLFRILKNEDCNVLRTSNKGAYKEMRKGMITAILHTDMTKHGEMIKELGLFYQLNSDALDRNLPGQAMGESEHNVQLIMNMLLHGADISNPMRPWEVCQSWAHRCIDEFFAQGDKEKAAGVPVQPLNDRDKVSRANSQVGFIEFAVFPLAEAMVRVFPVLDGIMMNLGKNIRFWSKTWQSDAQPPPNEIEKVESRVQKIEARCSLFLRSSEDSPLKNSWMLGVSADIAGAGMIRLASDII